MKEVYILSFFILLFTGLIVFCVLKGMEWTPFLFALFLGAFVTKLGEIIGK